MPEKNGDCRVDGLSGPARQVHRSVLAAFARTGQHPARSELERLARRADVSLDAALAELADTDAMAFDAGGDITPELIWVVVRRAGHPGLVICWSRLRGGTRRGGGTS